MPPFIDLFTFSFTPASDFLLIAGPALCISINS